MSLTARVRRLLELKNAYYNNGKPAYDALEDLVRDLDPEHPVLDLVGAPPAGGWDIEARIAEWHLTHATRMIR